MNDQNPNQNMNNQMNANQNPSPMTNGMPPMPGEQPKRNMGAILTILIIVLLVIIGAIYFINRGSTQSNGTMLEDNAGVIRNESNLEAELESDLDAQLQDIEYSF